MMLAMLNYRIMEIVYDVLCSIILVVALIYEQVVLVCLLVLVAVDCELAEDKDILSDGRRSSDQP